MLLLLALMVAGCKEIILWEGTDGSLGEETIKANDDVHKSIKNLNGLELVLETDKEDYLVGESVPLRFKVINTGIATVQFTFSSSQRFDFLVKHDDTSIWKWSFGVYFLQVLSEITLPPGESLTYEAQWPQVDNTGNPVPTGIYEVTALLTSAEPLESASLTIQIQE
jgi:hypothetical protein